MYGDVRLVVEPRAVNLLVGGIFAVKEREHAVYAVVIENDFARILIYIRFYQFRTRIGASPLGRVARFYHKILREAVYCGDLVEIVHGCGSDEQHVTPTAVF